jgi:AraC-like DNA-binding protein
MLTSGEAQIWCRGEAHTLSPGSVLMIEPGDVHRDLQKTQYSAVTVALRGDLVMALRGADDRGCFSASVARCSSLCGEALALAEAVRAGQGFAEQQRQALRVFRSLAPFWTRTTTRSQPPLVARALRALAESSAALLSLDQLAKRLRCAPTYLCRAFSEHTGVGPHAYQLQLRLLEAGRLMEGGKTVAAAAALTGFGDPSHLRRHFRRRFAVAPGCYQRQLAASGNANAANRA